MSRIICLGYYGQHNLGDECFKIVLQNLLAQAAPECQNVVFLNPHGGESLDTLRDMIHDKSTIAVIVGGGDLIRDFWMPKIRLLLVDFDRPKLALSVGISYPDCAPYLKHFDSIIVRSKEDLSMIQPLRPDAAFLPDMTAVFAPKYRNHPQCPVIPKSFTLAICLARPCFHTNDLYNTAEPIANAIVEGLQSTAAIKDYTWNLVLLPFNTNGKKWCEIDIPLQQALKAILTKRGLNITSIEREFDAIEMLDYLNQNVDLVLGMRYHSIMFSLITKTPFIALYSQPKIHNLIADLTVRSSSCHLDDLALLSSKLSEQIEAIFEKQDTVRVFSDALENQYVTAIRAALEKTNPIIISESSALLMPTFDTRDKIINWMVRLFLRRVDDDNLSHTQLKHTIEFIRKSDSIPDQCMAFLKALLSATRFRVGDHGVHHKDDELKIKEYSYGFIQKVKSDMSSGDFMNDVIWIIEHFVRNT